MDMDIKKIAKLSRFYVSDEDVKSFEKQLGDMLLMVENLPELDNENLLDREHIMELREDVVEPSMQRALLLEGAPEAAAGCVLVPKTVE